MKISDTHQLSWIVFLFAGIWCVSFASECVPPYGYKGCACMNSPKEINNTEFVNLLPLKSNSSSPSPCGVFNKFINQNQTGYKACVKASVGRWTQESTHVCESLGDDSSAKFLSTKYLALTSKCCCKGKCGIPPAIIPTRTTTGSPKGGSAKQPKAAWKIALIVIGGVLFVLIVALIVYCCKKNRSGYQMI
ncbi:hypothetical protein P5673_031387 [Acropora cervicornis]|uniref:Uncharacterized protein n=1 Tax=Acropora cervicornis TaxID=6130 RepID=A0AAD9USU8_ACRCE|nr:hypothetical protein P5673_031387 [Acropora cervicornis]